LNPAMRLLLSVVRDQCRVVGWPMNDNNPNDRLNKYYKGSLQKVATT
jgi:hypothetical protein